MELKIIKGKYLIELQLINHGLLVGYIELKYHISSQNYLILDLLYIDKNYRQKGIGTKLMNLMIDNINNLKRNYDFNHIILEVYPLEENISFSNLKKFYEKFGFHKKLNSNKFMILKV